MAGRNRERVFDEMLCFLSEPIFQIPVRSYMDEHCLIFDPDMQVGQDHKDVYERYKKLIDTLLEAFCEDAKITPDQAIQGINRLNKIPDLHDMFYSLFEQVLAATDFKIFFTAMAKRNILIQEQVLAMILAATGFLPDSLTRITMRVSSESGRGAPAGSVDRQEQELLKQVMQQQQREGGGGRGGRDAPQKLDRKSVEITEQEAKSLVLEREQLEEKMSRLVIASGEEPRSRDTRRRNDSDDDEEEEERYHKGRPSGRRPRNRDDDDDEDEEDDDHTRHMSSSAAADAWLRAAQNDSTERMSATHSALAAKMSQLSPAELRQRQEFLREQRDKLLALKKAAREKQLSDAERSAPTKRPMSARAAKSALKNDGVGEANPEDQRRLAMRRAIAAKLREEVIGNN